MLRLVWVMVVAAVFAGCSPCFCPRVFRLQSLTFQDASGNPLTPKSVRTADGQTFSCGDAAAVPTRCSGNVITYEPTIDGSQPIHAEATTGETFDGDIAPKFILVKHDSSCCGDSGSFEDRSITLATP